jgi:hypothetical protein
VEKVEDEKAASVSEDSVQDELDPVALQKAFKFAANSSIALVRVSITFVLFFLHAEANTNDWGTRTQFVIMILLVPLPLFFSSVIYGVTGFTAWVVIGIIWVFLSAFCVVRFSSTSSPLTHVTD